MAHYLDSSIKKPKYLLTTHSSVQSTSTTAETGTVITGSEITYTPASDSSKVIYEIGFYAQHIEQRSFLGWYLQEYTGGSWSEINSRYRRNFGVIGHDNQSMRAFINFRYVLPVWSGSRQLRLIAAFPDISASNGGPSANVDLNQLTEWDGSGSVTDKFCNTSLLVYSI